MNPFKKASKRKCKLRLLLSGASGSGKTYSALTLACALTPGKVALIDTENNSAGLYSGKFDFDTIDFQPPFTPEMYVDLILAAEKNGYETLIIDSISHEWNGPGGCLDIQSELGGRYTDWVKVTPRHTKFVNAIIYSGINIIACARAKEEALADAGAGKNGKYGVVKLGTAPIQREGLAYEFTTTLMLNQNSMASASKDRTGIFTGRDLKITPDTAKEIKAWLEDGVSDEDYKKNLLDNLNDSATKGVDDFKFYYKSLSNEDQILIKQEMLSLWEKITEKQ